MSETIKQRADDLVYRIRRRVKDAYYWVLHRVHPDHRYHLVDTGLGPGYCDPGEALLHSAFACLDRFVFEQGGTDQMVAFASELRVDYQKWGGECARQSCFEQAKRLEEAAGLYVWWHHLRPANHAALDRDTDGVFGPDEPLFDKKLQTDGSVIHVMRAMSPERRARIDKLHEFERQLHEDDQAMLHRLVTLRPHLWA